MRAAVVILSAVIATSDVPCSDMPKSCAGARSLTTEKFGGDQKSADRWARKCGLSAFIIKQGKAICGL